MIRCEECGYDSGGVRQAIVGVIGGCPSEILRTIGTAVRAGGGDRFRSRPAVDVWSPLEYIAHTGDAIGWYASRVERVLTESGAVLKPFDWDAYTVSQRYHERDLDDVLKGLGDSCVGFAGTLAQLPDADWEKFGIGSDGGRRTVADLADRAAHEAWHHGFDVRNGLATS